nr:hypothetical protein GCM10020063_044590 [Dactylosporangium thailandense]
MDDPQIECRLELSDTDFIMSNHRVHGVSVLPGVTFLDILMRVLAAQGLDTERAELRRILFPEPVVTAEGAPRELRLCVGAPGPGGGRPVTAQSRWAGRPEAPPWRENMRAELVFADAPAAAPLDLAALRAGVRRSYPIAELYARARAEDIRHGPAMTCHGDLHIGDGYLLAELDLDPAAPPEDAFHLHPAKLDAATIAAYGQTEAVSRDPFIPMYLDRFRAPRPLRGTTLLYAPRVETLAASADVIDNDYGLYDAAGTLLAEFGKLTCKRIRHAGLISRLLADVPSAPAARLLHSGADAVRAFAGHLRALVGERLGRAAADVPVDAGFYELGLDSVAMLDISRELEPVAATALYPTLLFEHTDIAALAEHLGTAHAFHPPAATGDDPAPSDLAATLFRPQWTAIGAGPDPDAGRPLVVIGADEATVAALRRAGHAVDAHPGDELDLTDPAQAGRVVAAAADGAAYVRVAPEASDADPARPAVEVWTLASALHRRRLAAPGPILYVHPSPDPAGAAIGALGRTVAAEAPALRVRSVGVAAWGPDSLAAAIAGEAADQGGGSEIRHVAGRRETRAYAPLPGPGGPVPLRDGGVYLLTGADGALAGLVGEHLARRYRARCILLGRRPLGEPLAGRIAAWRAAGAEVLHVVADLTDAGAVRAAVERGRAHFGRIDGVLHLAGTLRDGLFPAKRRTDFADVTGPKAAGAGHLDDATAGDDLAFFAVFSSQSATVPNPGQCDYAYANAYLEHFAEWRAARPDRHGVSVAVAWPLWADGGMRIADAAIERARREHGTAPLPTEAGLAALESALAAGDGTVLVRYGDPDRAAEGLPRPEPLPPAAPHAEPAPYVGEVAIVGLAGQYPQAPDLRTFWRNLAAGRDCVTEVPAGRWDHERYFDAERGAPGRTYGRWGGFLDGIDEFDFAFFGISRKDAERMDPQERLFLTTAWQAIEDAGYAPQRLRGAPVGVFAGVTWSHYQLFDEDGVAPAAMHAAVANRVSYTLGLTGPSMAVDTACSSSLSAVHLAVQALRLGECDLAVAGGVNLTVHPQKYLQLAQGQFLSDDGRCRSFGEGGTGYVPAEGVGAVVLKPLAAAVRDGDHVYGIIRATALNHAGRTSGFTVPSPAAQADLIREAWRRGGVTPETVGYVEAHGTGTSLGDPIEIEALRAVFAESAPPGGCAVGSVKSSIGHAESAAGIAALTKVLLQLRYRTLAPSLHAERINPHIDLDGTPLHIQREAAPWPTPGDGGPRRAGVSAFGAGGANAHLVVEEAATVPPAEPAPGEALFVLSARDEPALRRYAGQVEAALADDTGADASAVTAAAAPADDAGADASAVTATVALAGDVGADASAVTAAVAELLGVDAATVDPDETLTDLGLDRAALLSLRERFGPISGLATPRSLASASPGSGLSLAAVSPGSGLSLAAVSPGSGLSLAAVSPGTGLSLAAVSPGTGLSLAAVSPGTGLSLADVAYTVQVGRAAMAHRLAVVAGDLPALRAALRAVAAGVEPPAGVLLGVAAGEHPALDPEGVGLHEVAARWVSGADVDWARLHRPGARRRVPLPGYPFAGERCWVGQWRRRGTAPTLTPEPLPEPLPEALPEPLPEALPEAAGEVPVDVRLLDDGVAVVTMRGDRNMFTEGLVRGLEAAFASVAAEPSVKAVVLTASGPAFSMGGTPDALERLARGDGRFTDVPFLYRGLLRCDRPVVAAITGHASGGGLAFGLYADVVVMAREPGYAANFLHYGFTPGMGATFILEHRFGRALASEMFYTGRAFDGAELERRGAQVRFENRADVLPAALAVARSIARQPEAAVAALKRELADRVLTTVDATVSREVALHERVLGSDAVGLVREHMGKVDRFAGRETPAPVTPGPDPVALAPAAPVALAPVVPGSAPVTLAPVAPGPAPVTPTLAAPPPIEVAPSPIEVAPSPIEVAAGPALDRDEVVAAIGRTLGAQLYLEPAEIDHRLTFSEMGIDSLGAVELVRDLNRRFGLDLDSVTVYDHPTVDRLADHALDSAAETRRLEAGATAPAPTTPAPAPAPAPAASAAPAPAPAAPAAAPAAPATAPAAPVAMPAAPDSVADEVPTSPEPVAAEPAPPVAAGPPPLRLAPVAAAPAQPAAPAEPAPVPAPVTVVLAEVPDGAADDDADDIAVIGMSGAFPDAPDVDAFWNNLRDGRCSIREVPPERWDPAETYDPDRHAPGRSYSKWAAPLADVDAFDAAFFRISPMEAELMDPQQRLFLQRAWAALDDAGYVQRGSRRCGVFVGSGGGDYLRLLEASGLDGAGQAFLGNSPSILAARIAYLLNLTGPTMSIDTACSSSLVAVHLAAESLRSGACDLAIAGGVAVMVTPRMHVWTSKTGMLSPTGRCAPFDTSADGIVLGEAVGAVVLKPLRRALADGDHVYAVVKASGVNGDGHTNGITAPSAESQAALLREVYARGGVSPADVGYVEAHGTGTPLGDPIEFKALGRVFGEHADGRSGWCAVGSVKGNVGHTTMAAGITGFIKAVQALRHRVIPPSPGFATPNPRIDLAGGPFTVPVTPTPFPPGRDGIRRAAVSSFGFSGTNAHVILTEAPPAPAPAATAAARAELVPVSAATESALRRRIAQLHDALPGDAPLRDLAHTLGTARAHLPARAAFVVTDVAGLRERLAAWSPAGPVPAAADVSDSDAGGDPGRRAELARLAAAYVAGTDPDWAALHEGEPVRRVRIPGYPFEPERYWPSGGRPAADTWRANPRDELVAHHRLAGRPVLAGAVSACWALASRGGPARVTALRWLRPVELDAPRTLRLRAGTDGAFTVEDGDDEVYVRGVAGDLPPAPPERLDVEAVAARCPARRDTAELYAAFTEAGLDYGPSYRIAGLAVGDDEALATFALRSGTPDGPAPAAAGGVLDPRRLDGAWQAIAALTDAAAAGPLLPFAADTVEVPDPAAIAAYAHVRRTGTHRYDVAIADAEGRVALRCTGLALRPARTPAAAGSSAVAGSSATAAEDPMLLCPHWAEAPVAPGPRAGRAIVVATPSDGEADALAESLGPGTVRATLGEPLPAEASTVDTAYLLCGSGSPGGATVAAAVRSVRALAMTVPAGRALRLTVAAAGAVATGPGDRVHPDVAGVFGVARSAAAEHRAWTVRCVDVGLDSADTPGPDAAVLRITAEADGEPVVAWRDGRARRLRFARAEPPAPPAPDREPFRDGGVYLVVGGAGGLGAALSLELARRHRARLVWTGRRELTPAIAEALRAVAEAGGEAEYVRADVTDPAAVRAAVAFARRRFGRLDGVLHAAGVWRDAALTRLDDDAVAEVLAPKLAGTATLLDALRDEPLDLCVLFSSAASFVAAGGQANYAAASAAQDACAVAAPFPVTVVNWGYWGGVGAVAGDAYAHRFAGLGVRSIEPEAGYRALRRILAAGLPQVLVLDADPDRLGEYGIAVADPEPAAGPDVAAVREYLRDVFAEVLKCRPETLRDRETFETFGVDSLVAVDLVHRLAADLGELPATLLFEHMTIDRLANHLLAERPGELSRVLPARDDATTAPEAGIVRTESDRTESARTEPVEDPGAVAVVGVTGRYPESPDLDALWRNLREGANCIREVPASRWDWREHFDPRKGRRGRTYGRWAGFIEDVDQFDAAHFSVLPRDAAAMDPQERLFLETCWNLLEEAGYLGPRRHEPATGVFVGTMYGSYGKLAAASGWPRGEFAGAHSAYWSLANRVSYTFDLTGPSFAVDSACSSSLTAVHLACESLRRGECRMAIAGGVNVIIHPAHLVALSAMNMLASGDGCRTFDAAADGYVPGEGVGAVLLKPLAAARADGDRIWAVIRASLANAGGKTSGYTVPNPNAQADLVRATLHRAGVDPATIGYVEAHGTGTELGDPIEIASLTRAFGARPEGAAPCPVGSVKANVGHLEGAAGIVGLTKVLLQLRHRELFPAASLDTVNPKIDFAGSPFHPQRELAPWPRPDGGGPRRAGVSSFGAGGANVHVVLEEPEPEPAPPAAAGPALFLLSARTPERLRAYAARVAAFLRTPDGAEVDPAALAYTSQVGRRESDERLAARADDLPALARRLAAFGAGEDAGPGLWHATASARPPAPPVDGGPDQLDGLARAWTGGADVDWPARWSGRPRIVAFPTTPFARRRFWLPDAPTDPATDTALDPATDPAGADLTGDAPHLREHRVRGERWLPGAALLDAVRTAAAGSGVDADVVRDLRWLAPVRLDDGTERLPMRFRGDGTATAFTAGPPDAPVATGTLEPGPGRPEPFDLDAVRARCGREHDVTAFYEGLAAGGLEYGPGMRAVRDLWTGEGEALARLDGGPVSCVDGALQALAALGTAGDARVPVGFDRADYGTPFTGAGWAWVRRSGAHRFDLDLADETGRAMLAIRGLRVAAVPAGAAHDADSAPWSLLRPAWGAEPLPPRTAEPPALTILIAPDAAVAAPARARLERDGGRCVTVVPGDGFARDTDGFTVRAGARDDLYAVAETLAAEGARPGAVLRLPADEPAWTGGPGLDERIATGLLTVLWMSTALLAERGPDELRIVYGYASASPAGQPHDAAVTGALRTLALEHQRVRGVVVAFEGADATAGPRRHAEALVDELLACGPQADRVRYTGGRREVRRLERAGTGEPVGVRPGGAYLVTGGAGGLGLRFARHLAERGAGAVVLIGRSELDGDRRAALDGMPAGVEYHAVDVTDGDALERLVAAVTERHGPLRGVLHAAGVTRDARSVAKTEEQVAAVLAAKVAGTVAVDRATAGQPLDFVALFSSVVAETGNPGQVDYAYANAFLAAFAGLREQWRAAGTRTGRTVAIGWPLWRDSGMRVDEATLAVLRRRFGMVPLDPEDGLRAFAAALALDSPEVVVDPSTSPVEPPVVEEEAAGGDAEDRVDAVRAELREMAAAFLLVDPAEVELGAELMDLGFDSISLTELVNQVNERYGLDLLPTVLFECPDLDAFAGYLVRTHPAAVAARHPALTPTPAPTAAAEPVAPAVPVATAEPRRRRIAVIGMAGVLPGSADLDEFWRHLRAGDDLVGEVPADRADLRADPGTRHLRGGFLSHVDRFAAGFFGVAPREAALMDPQQRLFLQTAWRAVQDAGYRPSALAGTATGLFAGVSTSDYQDLLKGHGVPIEAHTATGIAHSILANRVSYLLDLRGPSEVVDTACSSSLVAVHRAVAALRAGDCDLALAGGVNVLLSPGLFNAFTQSGMLSPDGRCKTFDAGADGYVRGEGCGVVVLKDLERAERDGDHIYAEVLGSAVNHGGRAPSLTAPNPAAQARVIAAAWRDAAVDPETIGYLEAHGTGTKLGDPVEIEGVKQALADLGRTRPGGEPLAIGAVKTNVGHLEAAAGIAGILKVLLAMRHGELPPSLHLRQVNPHVRLDGTPLRLQTRLSAWPGTPRRAGVSSFGFGGTNAHVVLEAHGTRAAGPAPAGPHAFVLSAPAPEALAAYAAALSRHLRAETPDLARVAWTLQTGREDLAERLAVVTASRDELAAALEAAGRGETPAGLLRGTVLRSTTAPDDPGPAAGPLARAEAWVAGAPVGWAGAWPSPPGRVPLPGFPFTETRHWFTIPPAEVTLSQPATPPGTGRPKLRLTPLPASTPTPEPAPASAPAPTPAPASAPASAPADPGRGRDAGAVEELVVARLGQILGLPKAAIPLDQPFGDLGLDSIYRMELVRLLNATFELDLKATELYEYDTVDRLSAFVAAAAEPVARETPDVETALAAVIDAALERPWDRQVSFADNGFTSFDMLRVVGALERGLGAMRKTVLFDHPTLGGLAAHLTQQHGDALAARLAQAAPPRPEAAGTTAAGTTVRGTAEAGPWMVAKQELDAGTATLVAELEQRHGKEGGLPGRDIAPLLFIGSRRTAYFNASQRDGVLLAWSYVGSAADLEELTAEWVAHAERHGLRPNQLSMVRLSDVAGRPFTATPFGVVQRLDKLPEFTLEGGPMTRVRSLVSRFQRAGKARVEEYRVGSDPATDQAIVGIIDGWTATKEMINPYVGTVRDEIGRGVLAERHRMFLTHVDDELIAAVIVTRIPSEPGYLLDLEFYPHAMPRGGLEYTIVAIIERITAEGSTMFSFGGTFGVQVTGSPNADPAVERALAELRESGVFSGEGNFRFKNKFRPVNLPIYLCRPADADPADVTAVLLMITNPTVKPAAPAKVEAPPPRKPEATPYQGQLDRYGHNPVRIPAAEVGVDLLTDSWAELDADFVRAGTAAVRERAAGHSGALDLGPRPALPFSCVVPAASGRSAEALLCRAWAGPGRYVVQNPLFPTWTLSRLDRGLTALPVRRTGADLDPEHLAELLAAYPGDIAFVAVEVSTNALGGLPLSLDNLRRVRAITREHGVSLVLDATRLVDNAVAVAERDGRDAWAVAGEMLALADAVTMGLSKDFGVDRGGLVATSDPALAERLREHVALRGCEVNLADRRLIDAALADPQRVVAGVRARMAAVAALAQALRSAEVPIVEPVGGHCVLLDTARMPRLAGLAHPVQALLAWLYAGTGVRGAAHLADDSVDGSGAWVRLAVPVGLPAEVAAEAGRAVAERYRDPAPVPDLLIVDGTGPAPQAVYHPAGRIPEDVRAAMDEGHRPADDNWAVLREHQPRVRRDLVRLDDGEVEVFTAGDGPVLLLMPPFNIGAGFYAPQFAALADRMRVVAVHHAGVGATTAAESLSIDGIVGLMARTLDALGLHEPVHLAGSSFGGLPAAAFALRHPERVASLTLIASSYRVGNRAGEMNRLSLVAREDFERLTAAGVTRADEAEAWERLLLRCESMDAQIGLRYLDEFAANPDLLGRLPGLAVPTLLVHGRLDSVVPLKTAHLLHGTIPDTRYEELPDAGHFPSLTHAARVNALLAEFTAR